MKERIIDANLNRLAEGLRVIEDIVRFGLDEAPIAARLKAFRHQVGCLRAELPLDLLSARDSQGDVGREKVRESARRDGPLEILEASFGRVAESLRVVEEWSKLGHAPAAHRAKAMRYEAYELHKLIVTGFSRTLLASRLRGLYLILTDPLVGYETLTKMAVAAGVAAIQLRAKTLESGPLLALARRLRDLTAGTATLFIVNDRPDIARLAGADGLHLGQTDLSIADARAIVGERVLIGKSTHNLRQLSDALVERPDYVGIGPVFATQSKANPSPALGLEKARRMLLRVPVPAVAIGGIDEENLPALGAAGFRIYALIAAVGASPRPRAVLRRLQAIERSIG